MTGADLALGLLLACLFVLALTFVPWVRLEERVMLWLVERAKRRSVDRLARYR